jgi:hypothetical protein
MCAFKVQMFSSPGIRKDKQDDQEFSEDATGFIIIDNYVILWVADGAPGTNIGFEGLNFNSKVLAKCMGECFESVALKDKIPKTQLDEAFVKEFIYELHNKLSTLLKSVHECLKQRKDVVNLDEILEIKMIGKEKTYSLTWSTTFVGVIIDIKNKICYTMSVGDCFVLVNENTASELNIITGESNRLFIEWSMKKSLDSFNIELVKHHPHIEKINNINSIILMSDGVINYNEIDRKFKHKNIENIWDELKLMNNKTDDDKTAVFFKIME